MKDAVYTHVAREAHREKIRFFQDLYRKAEREESLSNVKVSQILSLFKLYSASYVYGLVVWFSGQYLHSSDGRHCLDIFFLAFFSPFYFSALIHISLSYIRQREVKFLPEIGILKFQVGPGF